MVKYFRIYDPFMGNPRYYFNILFACNEFNYSTYLSNVQRVYDLSIYCSKKIRREIRKIKSIG